MVYGFRIGLGWILYYSSVYWAYTLRFMFFGCLCGAKNVGGCLEYFIILCGLYTSIPLFS
jgi:hypothetical protein